MATRRTPDTPRTPKPAATPTQAKAPPVPAAAKPEPAKRATKPRKKDAPIPAVIAQQGISEQSAVSAPQVSEDVRRAMIAESAYLRAEKRGFAPGGEAEDWLAAEREVDALLKANPSAARQ